MLSPTLLAPDWLDGLTNVAGHAYKRPWKFLPFHHLKSNDMDGHNIED
jgi:hypothetical protein